MANLVSFVILCSLLYGRRITDRGIHGAWMTSVILADVTLIFFLVLSRDALEKVEPAMPALLAVHLVFALATVILYLIALVAGVQILLGRPRPGAMRRLDRVIVPCRIMTLVTSVLLQAFATR